MNNKAPETAKTETTAATFKAASKLVTETRVCSFVEKSIFENPIAIDKNVNNGPKPVKMVGVAFKNL